MKPVCLFFILVLSCPLAFAQSIKVVYQLDELEKTNLAINSVNALLKEVPDAEIILVVHGPAIIRLSNSDGIRYELRNLLDKGVEIGACNNSVLSNGLKPELLLPGVTLLTQGGVKKILELQQAGYLYIKI